MAKTTLPEREKVRALGDPRATASRLRRRAGGVIVCLLVAGGCAEPAVRPATPPPPVVAPPPPTATRSLDVTATAFNSTPGQTDGHPLLTASGSRLRPGMRVIAVSRDLEQAGLTFGTRVRIEGLDGEWVVADRMASRWQRKIDVYMGQDVAAARRFGAREVRIRWTPNGDADSALGGPVPE